MELDCHFGQAEFAADLLVGEAPRDSFETMKLARLQPIRPAGHIILDGFLLRFAERKHEVGGDTRSAGEEELDRMREVLAAGRLGDEAAPSLDCRTNVARIEGSHVTAIGTSERDLVSCESTAVVGLQAIPVKVDTISDS